MKRSLSMTVLWWIIGLAAAIVALKLTIRWAEPYLAFVPRRGPTPPPQGLSSIALSMSDGTRLTGWRSDIPAEGPVFLYFCGNAGNLSDREDLMARAHAAGMAIVAFNYRGTGESDGCATERCVHGDSREIYRYMIDSLGVGPERLILWGHSIGGAIASELASDHRCGGLVLEATFRSAEAMAKRMLPFLPVQWLMTYRLDNEENVARLSCPVLFIHGTDDLTIPPSDTRHLYGLATGAKELWLVEGADHNNIYEVAGGAFFARLLQFGQSVTSGHAVAR